MNTVGQRSLFCREGTACAKALGFKKRFGMFVELFYSRPIWIYITDNYPYKWIIDLLVIKKNHIILKLEGTLKNEPQFFTCGK